MPRKYDSSRRREAAEETRRRILRAALELHWEGVTEFRAIARRAGCSEATVRKYFPTKEALFQDCTRAFAETLEMPDLDALAGIPDPEERLVACVSELCRIHESMSGYAWLSAHARDESPTLDREMRGYEQLTDAVTRIVAPDDKGAIRGMLDFLTWRALRFSGALTPEDARTELTEVVRTLIPGGGAKPHARRGERS